MAVENRPFAGTWKLNNRRVVKHTPDVLVYVNGDVALPGCQSCGGRIDIQPYITQVSVDPSTEGPATASISMHIPQHVGDSLFRDGNFILKPGLEIHIYFRGYFPVKGSVTQSAEQTGGVNLKESVLYPYYQVHHGVVTDVNYDYSGGEHTATLSVTDLLHFWQYQRISTSGSLFGARPSNSKVKMSLIGGNLTGMSPFSIVYQMYRDVMGAAGGAEFALGSQSTAAANSTVSGESLFSLSILYWQKRFSQSISNLRMFGMDGTMYNGAQAAFVASLSSTEIKSLTEDLTKNFADPNLQSTTYDISLSTNPLVLAAKTVGFDPNSLFAGAAGGSKKGETQINVASLQGFVSDISNWGSVNLFESTYMTKMEVISSVKEACGFEFYMDVDGDIVFKPPFYNLDTSKNRVYRIEDIDIISFSASEKEPEATVVKATGSWFKNLKVPGLEGEWGTRAEFIDYRLVAQFGWRQATFETAYHTDPQAMYFACIARFDLFNIGIESATCTIPLRPELRPGYPVYIVPFDCFYYVHSFSHSFSFGGQCTTSLNLVGKRSKFYAPGDPPLSGAAPTVADIRLNNPHLPALPLEVYSNDGIPKLQGFPNVVMTIDTELVNPLQFARGVTSDQLQTEDQIQGLITQVIMGHSAVLQQSEDGAGLDERTKAFEGPFQIQIADGSWVALPSTKDLLTQAQKISKAFEVAASDKENDASKVALVQSQNAELVALLAAVQDVHTRAFPGDDSASYLELLGDLKAAYNPGGSMPGYYRYYSSAHPDPEMQGPRSLSVDPATGAVKAGALVTLDASSERTTIGFVTTAEAKNDLGPIAISGGIPLAKSGTNQAVVTPTHAITSVQIAKFETFQQGSRTIILGDRPNGFPVTPLAEAYTAYFAEHMQGAAGYDSPTANYESLFEVIANTVRTQALVKTSVKLVFTGSEGDVSGQKGVFFVQNTPRLLSDLPGEGVLDYLTALAQEMGLACAQAASAGLSERQQATPNSADVGIAQAWSACWPEGSNVQSKTGSKNQKSLSKTQTKTHYVPVFPVSDERGYKVVGTYAYGRGLNIEESLSQLTSFTANESVDYEAVESFVLALKRTTGKSKAVGVNATSDPVTAAKMAAASDLGVSVDVLDGRLGAGSLTQNMGTNWMANTKESTQKVSVVNAAYSLADLGSHIRKLKVCACKGADADVLLEAFNQSLFTSLGAEVETEQIQDWLTDQSAASSVEWGAVQDAYRGQVVSTNASGQAIDQLSRLPATLLSAVREAADIASSLGDVGAELTANVQAVPEASKTDIAAALEYYNQTFRREGDL